MLPVIAGSADSTAIIPAVGSDPGATAVLPRIAADAPAVDRPAPRVGTGYNRPPAGGPPRGAGAGQPGEHQPGEHEGGEQAARDRAGIGAVARGGALNLLGAVVSAIGGFVATALISHGLGKDEAGVLFAATSVFLVGTVIAKLGTLTGLVYWLTRLRTLDRPDLLRRCLTVALRPVLVASVLGAVVLWFAAPLFGGGDYAAQIRLLVPFLPLAALSDALLAATRGYRKMRPTVLVEKIGRAGIQVAALAVLLLVGATAHAYVIGWVGGYALSALLAALWLAKLVRRDPAVAPPAADAKRLNRDFWAFTAPRALASVAQLALQRLDVVMVAALVGFGPAAVYTVATRFVVAGQFANQAISTAVEPRLAELLTRRDLRAANALYQTATAGLVLLTWPLYLGVAVFAPLYLSLFPAAYHGSDAQLVVVVMAAAMLFANGCGMVDVALAMAGKTRWNMINVGAALVVNIGLNLLLIPHFGIVGAAWSWLAALVVNNAVPLLQIMLSMGLHPFGRGTLLAYAIGLVCFGAVGVAARLTLGAGLAGCAAAVAVGGVLYLGAVYALRRPLNLNAVLALRKRRRAGAGQPAPGGQS